MKLFLKFLVAAAAVGASANLTASAAPIAAPSSLQAFAGPADSQVQTVQWRRGWRGGYGRGWGPAIVGGAIVGGAIAATRPYRYYDSYYAYGRSDYPRERVWVRERDRDCDDD